MIGFTKALAQENAGGHYGQRHRARLHRHRDGFGGAAERAGTESPASRLDGSAGRRKSPLRGFLARKTPVTLPARRLPPTAVNILPKNPDLA